MKKNKKRSIILLIFGVLTGPVGTIIGIFKVGDKGFSGSNNVKALDSYYLIDYLTISASYNLAIILGLTLIAWVLKSRKVSLSKILQSILIGHFFFFPSFFVSLFLSVIPMEGNLKGFFVFPAFILTAIGGIIGFLIFYIIKLIALKKENTRVLDIKSLKYAGVLAVILLFFNFTINNHSVKEVSLMTFEHEDFRWEIKQRSKTKAGMVKTSTNDPYIVYIEQKNGDSEISSIQVLENYHSIYTRLDSIIPIQTKAIAYNKLNPSYSVNYNSEFEVIHLNKKKSIYRLRKYKPSYTLCLTPSQATLEQMNIIAEDIKQNSPLHNDLNNLMEGFVVEAVAMNKNPIIEERFLNNDGSLVQVSLNGEVVYRNKPESEDYNLEWLGEIKEGVFYSLPGNFDIPNTPRAPYKSVNYDEYKNGQNQSLENLYTHINGRTCATDIEFAIENCEKTERIYLLDKNMYTGIPTSINELSRLTHITTNGIDLGKLSENICDISLLNTINFYNSETLTFPECMGNLNNLYIINAINCNLNEIPKSFYNVNNLNRLTLTGNNIVTIPKELTQLKDLYTITIDFNPNLDIDLEFVEENNITLRLAVYSEEESQIAEKFIEQYATDHEQLREQIYDSIIIDEEY